jgi:hypothetical protein
MAWALLSLQRCTYLLGRIRLIIDFGSYAVIICQLCIRTDAIYLFLNASSVIRASHSKVWVDIFAVHQRQTLRCLWYTCAISAWHKSVHFSKASRLTLSRLLAPPYPRLRKRACCTVFLVTDTKTAGALVRLLWRALRDEAVWWRLSEALHKVGIKSYAHRSMLRNTIVIIRVSCVLWGAAWCLAFFGFSLAELQITDALSIPAFEGVDVLGILAASPAFTRLVRAATATPIFACHNWSIRRLDSLW